MESTAYLAGALALVREHDPDTYAAMLAADWQVETVTPRTLWSNRYARYGLGFVWQVGEGFASGALAITLSERDNPSLTLGVSSLTVLSPDSVLRYARYTHATRDQALASVLVHEYTHTLQPTTMADSEREREAYAAGSAFARKAGAYTLAAQSDQDGRDAVADLDGRDALAQILAA